MEVGFASLGPLLVEIADEGERWSWMIADIEGANMCWAGLRVIRFGGM